MQNSPSRPFYNWGLIVIVANQTLNLRESERNRYPLPFMIKPFHQWKQEIVKADSKKHNVSLYFRWTREEFYSKYGTYVQKERSKKLTHDNQTVVEV